MTQPFGTPSCTFSIVEIRETVIYSATIVPMCPLGCCAALLLRKALVLQEFIVTVVDVSALLRMALDTVNAMMATLPNPFDSQGYLVASAAGLPR